MLQLGKKVFAFMVSVQLSLVTLSPVFAANETALRVMDTTAGKPALIMVTGEPNEVVSLTITNPYKSTVTQNFQLNNEGVLQYWYSQAVIAGEYVVSYGDEATSFSVSAAFPDTQRSEFDLSDYTAYVGEKIQGKISLKDHYGNVIAGRQLKLDSKGNATVSCTNNCRTNQQGIVQVTISSQKPGLKKLSVIDSETGSSVFMEDLGFIPYLQNAVANNQPRAVESFTWTPSESFDYIPVLDPYQASFDAQGNDDRFVSQEGSSFNYLGANLLQDSRNFLAQAETTTQVVQSSNTSQFQIIFGNDPEQEFAEEQTVQANSALDFFVKAVDSQGNVVPSYTGDLEFEIDPSGPLLPQDYSFSGVEQGVALFELALVLTAGEYTLTVTDKANSIVKGEVKVTAQLGGVSLNNTEIVLKIDSPISNSVYSSTVSVQGTTNTDNTEVSVKEGGVELKKGSVDANKNFNFPIELADGLHKLDITATYLVDGSQTTTTVDIEVDKTPPVIEKVNAEIPDVRAGENFTMTVEAEEDSILKAFINNRAYDFVGAGKLYTLTAKAPLDVGQFPISLQISDELGNMDTVNDVGNLTVTEALQEVSNLFGIPGLGTMTLSWDPVPGATAYEVSYKSILGSSEQPLTTTNTKLTVEKLDPEISYVFTVTAKNAAGEVLSLSTESRALKALAGTGGQTVSTGTENVIPLTDLKGAAEQVQTLPARHTSSGPEVYLLVLLSILVLNGYGRIRKAFAQSEQ